MAIKFAKVSLANISTIEIIDHFDFIYSCFIFILFFIFFMGGGGFEGSLIWRSNKPIENLWITVHYKISYWPLNSANNWFITLSPKSPHNIFFFESDSAQQLIIIYFVSGFRMLPQENCRLWSLQRYVLLNCDVTIVIQTCLVFLRRFELKRFDCAFVFSRFQPVGWRRLNGGIAIYKQRRLLIVQSLQVSIKSLKESWSLLIFSFSFKSWDFICKRFSLLRVTLTFNDISAGLSMHDFYVSCIYKKCDLFIGEKSAGQESSFFWQVTNIITDQIFFRPWGIG